MVRHEKLLIMSSHVVPLMSCYERALAAFLSRNSVVYMYQLYENITNKKVFHILRELHR